jgi:hypothetical protein
VERLVAHAAFLPAADQVLIEAFFVQGQSAADLALLSATARGQSPHPNHARALRRRLRQLIQRVRSREFRFVVAHLESFTPSMRRVARACILAGRSTRQAAEELGVSLYTVRRYRDAILAMDEAQHPTTSSPPTTPPPTAAATSALAPTSTPTRPAPNGAAA